MTKIEIDEIKIQLLDDLIKVAPRYANLNAFIIGMKEIRDNKQVRIEKETCRAMIDDVLLLMNNYSPNIDVHTFNKAKMYLNMELKAGKLESYLAYLANNAMNTNDFIKLRDHMKRWW